MKKIKKFLEEKSFLKRIQIHNLKSKYGKKKQNISGY
jgi:hypothetical protein